MLHPPGSATNPAARPSEAMSGLRKLIREIRRRSVWQVLGVYLVASWGALEAIDGITDTAGLPEWFPPFALALLIIGLPVVLATAVVQDGVGGRHERERFGARHEGAADGVPEPDILHWEERAGESDGLPRLFTWRNAVAGGVMAFALWGFIAAGWVVFQREPSDQVSRDVSATDAAPTALPEAGPGEAVGSVTVQSDPPGARVLVTPVLPVEGLAEREPAELGVTPLAAQQLPAGEYLVRLDLERTNPLDLTVVVRPDATTLVDRTLVAESPLTQGMVLVPPGPDPLDASAPPLPGFLIDRTEVTNRQYQAFLTGGGYENSSLWPETMELGGNSLSRAEALSMLVDQVGLPGPRGWSGGLYPEGTADHPVVGITWYEASAYARWAGKELPTRSQWYRAAVGDDLRAYPWGDNVELIEHRANFFVDVTQPAAAYPLGVSPWGVFDMAGNVREWLKDTDEGGRFQVVGGSFQDPEYLFGPTWQEAFDPGFSSPVLGLRAVKPVP